MCITIYNYVYSYPLIASSHHYMIGISHVLYLHDYMVFPTSVDLSSAFV